MRVSRLLFIVTHVCVGTVNANVEKAIFLGPSPVVLSVVPNAPPSLDALRLLSLLPVQSSSIVATQLPVQFPTVSGPRGLESWYLLRGLEVGRRYEVRICWPATVSSTMVAASLMLLHLLFLLLLARLCLRVTRWTDTHLSNPPTSGWTHMRFLTSLIPQVS